MPLNFPQVELTYDQKMALVGTDGPPTAENPYVTDGDARLDAAAALYSATTTIVINGAAAPTTGQALIATSATAASWQDLLKLATAAPQDVTKATAVIGSSSEAAKADHKHDISTAAPSSVGTSNAEGNATSLARSNHVHDHGSQSTGTHHAVATGSVNGFMSSSDYTKLSGIAAGATANVITNTAPVDVTKATAEVGTSSELARQDHKHDVTTAAPASTAVQIGNTASEGTSTSLARADHIHAVSAGTIGAVGTTTSNGTAATFARADHVHAGLTRGADDFGQFSSKASSGAGDRILIEDSADGYAKKYIQVQHLPAASFVKDSVMQNNTITTTSTSDVLATGMTLTPLSGTYLVFFTGSGFINGTMGSGRYIETSIYVGGVRDTSSIRDFVDQNNYYTPFNCFTVATVNGSQAIEGKWRTTYGTATMYGYRVLSIVKVG